ncbi:MAG TPA: 5-formyltetrahydrofolate cyclo-ligase [Euzebya sp.]|nr:5-formyltetrahydrofolate cyclo-ligase [Euzebya sp.]
MAARDHAADAGGDPAALAAKAVLRDEAWQAVVDAGAARFPGAFHRIPNFVGAEAAAEALRATPEWQGSATLKANPDSPQWPVRQRALEDGKTVFMAVPRLADDAPFVALRPEEIAVSARKAASIKGSAVHGIPVAVADVGPVALVVTGCVAVDRTGARLGKGGGFADLEFALAQAAGMITHDTVIATTVHDVQVLDAGRIPVTDHDAPLDLIVTPTRVIRVTPRRARPAGIRWEDLTEEKIASIPLLRRMAAER